MLWITWSSRILKWRCAKLKVGEFSATLPTLFWMTTNSDQHKSFKLVLCLASFCYESVEQTIIWQFWKKEPPWKKNQPADPLTLEKTALKKWRPFEKLKNKIHLDQMRLCQCMFKNEIFEYLNGNSLICILVFFDFTSF